MARSYPGALRSCAASPPSCSPPAPRRRRSSSTATWTRTGAPSTPTARHRRTRRTCRPSGCGPNFIENNDMPDRDGAGRAALSGDAVHVRLRQVCQNAEALLNRRGVPFTTVNVEEQKGLDALQKLTGAQQVPVLQVGDKLDRQGLQRGAVDSRCSTTPATPRRRRGASRRKPPPSLLRRPRRPRRRRRCRSRAAAIRSSREVEDPDVANRHAPRP